MAKVVRMDGFCGTRFVYAGMLHANFQSAHRFAIQNTRNRNAVGGRPHPYLHKRVLPSPSRCIQTRWFWRRQFPLITRPARTPSRRSDLQFMRPAAEKGGVRAQTERVNAGRKSLRVCVLTRCPFRAPSARSRCIRPDAKQLDDAGDGGRGSFVSERREVRRINLRRAMASSHVLSWRREYLICVNVFANERERAEQATRPPGRKDAFKSLVGVYVCFFSLKA